MGTKPKDVELIIKKLKFLTHRRKYFTASNESTISVNENIPKDLDDGFYLYANIIKHIETELEEFKSLTWKEYPENFKLFLIDFCILNGDAYSKYFYD